MSHVDFIRREHFDRTAHDLPSCEICGELVDECGACPVCDDEPMTIIVEPGCQGTLIQWGDMYYDLGGEA